MTDPSGYAKTLALPAGFDAPRLLRYDDVTAHAITRDDLGAPSLALGGVAMGMVAPTLVDVTLAGVHGRDAGSASGVLNTALQLGGAIGVALIGVIYFDVIASEDFVQALRDALWFELAIYLLSALAMLLLPKQAIATYGEPSLEQATVES